MQQGILWACYTIHVTNKNPLWYQPHFLICFLWPSSIIFILCENDTTDLILLCGSVEHPDIYPANLPPTQRSTDRQ